jgi:hypothetical protein
MAYEQMPCGGREMVPKLLADCSRRLRWLLTPLAASLALASPVPGRAEAASVAQRGAGDAGKAAPHQYQSFSVAIYLPVQVVRGLEKRETLEQQWAIISQQVKVDKVYIESRRDRVIADDALLEDLKKFLLERGVRVAGGITFSDGAAAGQFRSFCQL